MRKEVPGRRPEQQHYLQEEAAGDPKKGQANMREYGNVSIPQEALIAALWMEEQ